MTDTRARCNVLNSKLGVGVVATMSIMETVSEARDSGLLLKTAARNLEAWAGSSFLPDWARSSIDELVTSCAWEELNDRFFKYLEFGTGGMRGRTIGRRVAQGELGTPTDAGAPEHPAVGTAVLNDFNIIRATIGLYRYCRCYLAAQSEQFETPRLVIAHDVRHFSSHFCELAASTWTRLGGLAMIFDGPRPTPQLSFSVRHLNATAGVVITASHNPPHDNGFKVYFCDGAQVVSPHAEGIIDEVYKVELDELSEFLGKQLSGVVVLPVSVDEDYLEILEENVLDRALVESNRPKVVFTPIHGTGGVMGVPALERFGIEPVLVEEQMEMDPRFPTVASPNPENAEALSLAIEKADQVGADLVVATDPDCDRMGVAVRGEDGSMVLLTGNLVGALLAEYRITTLKRLGWLPSNGTRSAALVKTFVTTPLQDTIAKTHGLKVINTLTGFKWIGEKLLRYEQSLISGLLGATGIGLDYDATLTPKRAELLQQYSTFYVFGCEESYGYLGSDRVRDKDGNAAVLMFCELAAFLNCQGKSFSEYLAEIYLRYGYFKEDQLNLYYEGALGAEKIKKILDSYRESPPEMVEDFVVTSRLDFARDEIHDEDGDQIPAQDFFFYTLDNGYSYAVRGSGTEPKIKFYLFAREDVPEPAALPEIKKRTSGTLNRIKDAIDADAAQRVAD